MNIYEIAGQIIALNWDISYIHPYMESFHSDGKKPIDLTFELQENTNLKRPENEPLIHSNYMSAYSTKDGFLLFYEDSCSVNACFYDEQARRAIIYLTGSLSDDSCKPILSPNSDLNLSTVDYLFYTIRDVFLLWIQKKDMIAVHSSTIIYKEKAYLFSACSGTGKTTHTNMWVDRFHVDILDGDITVLALEDDIPVAYGIPWCGTSGKYLNRRVLLGGIIFLAQACHNRVSKLTLFEAILRCSARCFTPTWTKELSNLNLSIVERLIPKTLCCFLECLPDQGAVDTIKTYIDSKQ
ncbi:MAG: hypothetical protein PUC65_01665 [Clostridiales bacterium]|nr:hypothetical protein [Clostridiales bacterium]